MRIFFSVWFFFSAFATQADMGDAYLMNVEIEYDKGIEVGYSRISGYFDPDTIEHLNKKGVQAVISFLRNMEDEHFLILYRKVYTIDSLFLTFGFKDQMVKIPYEKIKKFTLITIVPIDLNLLVNDVTVKDLNWINKSFNNKSEYHTRFCIYTIYYFSEQEEREHSLLKKGKMYLEKESYTLTDQEDEDWNKLLQDYFKSLSSDKVLIVVSCGC